MVTVSRDLVRARGGSRLRRGALGALAVTFAAIVAYGALESVRFAESLDDRRAAALVYRTDPVEQAGSTAAAYRRFRAEVDGATRFSLVFGPALDRNERGFHRLFAGYYLYPAIAVDEPARAIAVMVFGEPQAALRRDFERIAVLDGVWLGRRKAR